MKKILNILLFVLILTALAAMSIYFIHEYRNEKLQDVNLVIENNTDDGFVDYYDTYDLIMNICDTATNNNITLLPVDSIVTTLDKNPWITDVFVEVNLHSVLDVNIVECQPILRIYNAKGKSVYLDEAGNIFPTNNDYVPNLLVGSGYLNFPIENKSNVYDSLYISTDLPEMFEVMKAVCHDEYAKHCVKQVYKNNKKNYIFSLNNTNIIVIFGDANNVREKLSKMQNFFDKMKGNPELENYKEINLNYKNQVVCTKKNK